MINLCTPIIGGPLSALSIRVQLSGCVPGATVEVTAANRAVIVATSMVTVSDPTVDLAVGAALQAGDQLVATQYLTDGSGDRSDETPIANAVVVGSVPSGNDALGPVDFVAPLWECGRHVWVKGAIPGAAVEVTWGTPPTLRGLETADGNGARFTLTQGLPLSQSIKVRQVTPTGQGPTLSREAAALSPADTPKLHAPFVQQPIRNCQTAVVVSNVIEGADVVLTRASGLEERLGFDVGSAWFTLSKPLDSKLEQWVSARQELIQCERQSDPSPVLPIDPAGKPPMPVFNTVLWEGAVRVQLAGLIPGAEVQFINGPTHRRTLASAPLQDFEVAALIAGKEVTVTQSLCGISSDPATATVESPPAVVLLPQVVGPLARCARSVAVRDALPGASLQVMAKGKTLGSRALTVPVTAKAVDVALDVTPYLLEEDEVWVDQWLGSQPHVESHAEPVGKLPPVLEPVIAQPVTRVTTDILVSDTVSGATVEVLRQRPDGSWGVIGSAPAVGHTTRVKISVVLEVDQYLQARQRICEVQTAGGEVVKVVKPVPLPPKLVSPQNGAKITGKADVNLSWSDAGATQDRKADSFLVTLTGGAVSPFAPPVVGMSATVPATQVANLSTTFTWTVTAINGTGSSSSSGSFHTGKATIPVLVAGKQGNDIICKGTGFIPGQSVEIEVINDFNMPPIPEDYRTGHVHVISDDQTIDVTFSPADKLGARTGIENGATVSLGNDVLPGADISVKARNEPPVKPGTGSSAWSNTEHFVW